MIQYQIKLQMTKAQQNECVRWLYHLASVWNWALRKIELNAKDKVYFSKIEFRNLLANHGEKLGIPSHVLRGILCTAYDAWQRCFQKLGGKPRLKGVREQAKPHSFSGSDPDASGEPCFSSAIRPGALSQNGIARGKDQVRTHGEARLWLASVPVHRG